MKYIYMLLTTIIILTAAIAFVIIRIGESEAVHDKTVLMINGRSFSETEMKDALRDKPHDMTDEQYKKMIIERELLIQEAMKLKMHEEPDFRKNIKNYYEQSLISALLNRKTDEFNVNVDKKQIDRMISRMGSRVTIETKFYRDLKSASRMEESIRENVETITFDDLSGTYRYRLAIIDKGDSTDPIPDEYGYKIIRLLDIKESKNMTEPDPALISVLEKTVIEEKRKLLVENWQQNLFNQSTIKYADQK